MIVTYSACYQTSLYILMYIYMVVWLSVNKYDDCVYYIGFSLDYINAIYKINPWRRIIGKQNIFAHSLLFPVRWCVFLLFVYYSIGIKRYYEYIMFTYLSKIHGVPISIIIFPWHLPATNMLLVLSCVHSSQNIYIYVILSKGVIKLWSGIRYVGMYMCIERWIENQSFRSHLFGENCLCTE